MNAMQKGHVRISKILRFELRHQPEQIGLTLDEARWIPVADLLAARNRH